LPSPFCIALNRGQGRCQEGVEPLPYDVPHQGAAYHIERRAVLQRQARRDSGVRRHDAGLRSRLVIGDEDFTDAAIRISADGGGVAKSTDLNIEGLG
jgi:hypothetical protein